MKSLFFILSLFIGFYACQKGTFQIQEAQNAKTDIKADEIAKNTNFVEHTPLKIEHKEGKKNEFALVEQKLEMLKKTDKADVVAVNSIQRELKICKIRRIEKLLSIRKKVLSP